MRSCRKWGKRWGPALKIQPAHKCHGTRMQNPKWFLKGRKILALSFKDLCPCMLALCLGQCRGRAPRCAGVQQLASLWSGSRGEQAWVSLSFLLLPPGHWPWDGTSTFRDNLLFKCPLQCTCTVIYQSPRPFSRQWSWQSRLTIT